MIEWERYNHQKVSARKLNQGFTIVELLIVVIIIGILAMITTVAYNGITRRANDAVVTSDLANFSKIMSIKQATNPEYAAGATTAQKLESLGWKATLSAYSTSVEGNLLFCHNLSSSPLDPVWGTPAGTRTNWALIALSAGGTIFYITDQQTTPQKYTGSTAIDFNASSAGCGAMITELGAPGYANVYGGFRRTDTTTGPWRKWASGV